LIRWQKRAAVREYGFESRWGRYAASGTNSSITNLHARSLPVGATTAVGRASGYPALHDPNQRNREPKARGSRWGHARIICSAARVLGRIRRKSQLLLA